jgi:hypothetical protein
MIIDAYDLQLVVSEVILILLRIDVALICIPNPGQRSCT